MTALPQPRTRTARQNETQPPTIAIALFVGLVLSAAFIGLAAVVIPGILLMVLVGFGMCLFFLLQYFLWAKWLYPIVMRIENETAVNDAAPSGRIPGANSESDQ